MVAPEPYLSACLEVLRCAVLHARMIGWSGANGLTPEQSAKVAELMDAVHNIPELLTRWEHCDEPMLRAFLETCDARSGSGLLAVYKEALTRARSSTC